MSFILSSQWIRLERYMTKIPKLYTIVTLSLTPKYTFLVREKSLLKRFVEDVSKGWLKPLSHVPKYFLCMGVRIEDIYQVYM